MVKVDAIRVVQDPAYAASLTDAQWQALSSDPTWNEMVGESEEIVAPVVALFGAKLGIPAPRAVPTATVPPTDSQPFQVIGKPVARLHGIGVVTDQGQYTQNMRMPGMLHTRTLRSPHPRATVLSVDTSKAEKMSGVVAVLHRGNLPEEYRDVKLGSGPPDRFLFNEEVFEIGSPVAVVAAESEHIADEAIHQIEVEYETLPATLDMMEGSSFSALKQWDNKENGTIIAVAPPLVRGDLLGSRADINIEEVLTRSTEQHLALELTNSLMYWEQNRLIVYYTNQHAHGTRADLSQALKIPENYVRVVQTGFMGSGYGYRSGIDLSEVHTAILARMTGRPIKTMYTREEDFVTRTHRPEFRNEMKLGVNRDGTIQSGEFHVYANVGAHRDSKAQGSWFNMQNLYKIPNLKLEATDVFTNSYKSGYYRCVSHPNGTFALEMMMEKAADAIGMDPVEFRLKNLNEEGNPDTGKPFSNPGIRECIEKAAERIDWKAKWHAPRAQEVSPGVFHGIGLAAHACSHGAGGDPATGQVIVNRDGSVQCVSGCTEIGPGQRTQMAMIAAEALGVPMNRVSITAYVDTDNTTDTGGTNGSRQTNTGGRGIYEAAMDAKRQILDFAARKIVEEAGESDQVKVDVIRVVQDPAYAASLTDAQWQGLASDPMWNQMVGESAEMVAPVVALYGAKLGIPAPREVPSAQETQVTPEQLDIKNGEIFVKADPSRKLSFEAVVGSIPVSILGRAIYRQDSDWQRTAWASHAAEVEVDIGTGTVLVTNFVAVHDVGQAINPFAVEQQIEGGVVMALGAVFTEEMLIDKGTGLPLNPNMLDYKALSILDVPDTIDVVIVERPKAYGVFGAHGIGEPPMAPPAPAVAAAIHNAVGVWMQHMPVTREKLLAELKNVR